jgi:hypothetical protein
MLDEMLRASKVATKPWDILDVDSNYRRSRIYWL